MTKHGAFFSMSLSLYQLCLYSEPLDRPENFQLDNSTLNSSSADFTWDPVDQSVERVQGFFRGYQVLTLLHNLNKLAAIQNFY